MIDKNIIKQTDKLNFIKLIYTKLYNEELDENEFMRRLNKKLFHTYDFESKELNPFKPNAEYGYRYYNAKNEPNDDVYSLAESVAEVFPYEACSVESDSFEHLSINSVSNDNNEYIMTLYLHNCNYNCEEYKIKIKMNRVEGNKFKFIILKWKRIN